MKLLADVYYIKVALLSETFDREIGRECLNWRFYAGGALIKVADSAILTVPESFHTKFSSEWPSSLRENLV